MIDVDHDEEVNKIKLEIKLLEKNIEDKNKSIKNLDSKLEEEKKGSILKINDYKIAS